MALDNLVAASLITWLVLLQRRQLERRKRQTYVRGINRKRAMEGEFIKLVLPMRTLYPDDHFDYFRMTASRFDDLLRRVGPKIIPAGTHRIPVSQMERLAVTLRREIGIGNLESKR